MHKSFAALAVAVAFSGCALAQPPDAAGQLLKAYKAAAGGSAWDTKETMVVDGDFNGLGLTGKVHEISDLKKGRAESDAHFGPASQAEGFDGTTPWQKDMSGTVTQQQGGDALQLAVNGAYRTADLWWLADFGGAAIANQGRKTDATGQYDVLTITPKGGKAFDAWFDAKTHLLTKVVEQQGSQMVATTLSDYRAVEGVMVPYKIVVDAGVGEKYLQTITVTKVTFLGAQPDSAYAAPNVAVSDFSIAGGAAATEVPISIINNHIYGPAKVNGKGPYTFIFDTGGRNLVTPPIAKELGIKIEGSLPGTGAGEGVMEGGFANGIDLQVGDAAVKKQLFLVLPLNTMGDVEGVPLPGMVGYETFRRFVTRIDYGAHTLTLIDPKAFDPKDAGTPVKFVFNDHIPEVMGSFEGVPAKYDIDTGARSELTLTKPFAEANHLRDKHPKGVEAVEGWGVGGPTRGYVTRGSEMTLGPVKIDGVVTTLATQEKGAFAGNDYSGNVGGGILKRFVVTFDYNNQIMYLKPLPGPVADTGTFDRAGMWFNRSDAGFKVVDVTKGGPAEEAGLKADDVVVAVDGKPAATLLLYKLREQLRTQKPGTVVSFKVMREGKAQTFKVKLRDLI